MIKNLIALSALLITCSGWSQSAVLPGTASVSLPELTGLSDQLKADMAVLASDSLGGRATGTREIEMAADYIIREFQSVGIKPYFEDYRDKVNGLKENAFNVVGWIPGRDPELRDQYIIIGAHYDHIGRVKPAPEDPEDVIANGANDNASGSVAVMALARYFASEQANGRSLIFALFSAEELGLKGSYSMAEKLKQEQLDIYAVVNFEMIGLPMQREELLYLTGYKQSNMAERMNAYAGEQLIGFLPEEESYQLFKRSDNYPFYKAFGIPSQTLSTFDFKNYGYYHHAEDESQYMNAEHMGRVVQKMIGVLQQMSTTADKEIRMNE